MAVDVRTDPSAIPRKKQILPAETDAKSLL